MKQIIIILGTVLLGIFIFNMMVGNQPDSLKNVAGKAMKETMEMYG